MEYAFLGVMGLGALLAAIGGLWTLVLAFREHVGWGLACLLCWLAQVLFVLQHWRAARRPLLLQCAGGLLFLGAGAGLDWARNRGGEDPFDPQALPAPAFPTGLGPAEELGGQVLRHELRLGPQGGFYGQPGQGGRVWVYLPPGWEGAREGSLPCVLVTPAGTSGLAGSHLEPGGEPEQLPYAQAGFVVVAYELDGPLLDESDAAVRRSYLAFREALAGLVDARNALELVLQRLPRVSPRAIFAAGEGSAGSHALLFAAHERRLAGCVAFAPVTDLAARHQDWIERGAWMLPGVRSFARRASPLTHVARLRCPVFLFHARDDELVDPAETQAYAARLRAQGADVTLQEATQGGHRQAMLGEGIPAAVEWLTARVAAMQGVRPAPLLRDAEARPVEQRPATQIDWTDPQAVLARAASPDPEVRREAVTQWQRRGLDRAAGARLAMLRTLGPAAAEPALLRALLRSAAEHPLAGAEAVSCLDLAPEELRRELLVRLIRFPDPALPPGDLVAAVSNLRDTPDCLVDEALIRVGQPRDGAAPRLVAARGEEWARSEAARALFDLLPAQEIVSLARLEQAPIRVLAVGLIAGRGAAVALAPLAALLRDPSLSVRQAAAGALGQLGEAQAVVPLLGALGGEKDEPTRVRLRRALADLPQPGASQVLEGLLADPGVDLRLLAVSGLKTYASPAAVRQLARALEDGALPVRRAALEALSELRGSRVAGVPESLRQLEGAIGRLAGSPDPDEKRLARHLYYQLTGRLPEGEGRQ